MLPRFLHLDTGSETICLLVGASSVRVKTTDRALPVGMLPIVAEARNGCVSVVVTQCVKTGLTPAIGTLACSLAPSGSPRAFTYTNLSITSLPKSVASSHGKEEEEIPSQVLGKNKKQKTTMKWAGVLTQQVKNLFAKPNDPG